MTSLNYEKSNNCNLWAISLVKSLIWDSVGISPVNNNHNIDSGKGYEAFFSEDLGNF